MVLGGTQRVLVEEETGGMGKHLVKRNYELWFAFGRNRKGEFLALTVHSGRQVKRTFFPAGDQRKGWWKLLVAVFELADRSVRSSKKSIKNEQAILLSKALTEKNQEKPVKASFRYPHCEVLIHFTMKVGDVRSCAAALQGNKKRWKWAGQGRSIAPQGEKPERNGPLGQRGSAKGRKTNGVKRSRDP